MSKPVMFKVLCSGLLCHTVSIMCHHVCLSVVLELAVASLTRERGKCCRSHRSAMHAAKKKPQHSGPKNVAIPCRTKFHCNSAACFRQGLTHSRFTTRKTTFEERIAGPFLLCGSRRTERGQRPTYTTT